MANVDNRKGTWVFLLAVAVAIRACTKSDATAHALLGTNAKTGTKLLKRTPVRNDIIKESAYKFLDFLNKYLETGELDTYVYFPNDVKKAAAAFAKAEWTDLIEEVSDNEKVVAIR